VTEPDRQLLLAAMEGDLAAGRALCDRLADLGDDRLPGYRAAFGSLVREVLLCWEEASAAETEMDLKWGPAAGSVGAMDDFVRWCHGAFWDWLLEPEDIDEAERLLKRSLELAGPAEMPQ